MMLYNGVQDDISILGDTGCAFLSSCRFFHYDIDDLSKLIVKCRNVKAIDNEYFILDWELLFNTLDNNNRKWSVQKTKELPANLLKDCCIIARYYNPRTHYSHFVLIDRDKHIIYDGLYNSVTVKEGYIADYRILTPIG